VVAALVQTRGAARARDVTAYGGLLRDHPVLAAALGLALLSLAGLPPGVLGLVAKVVALRPVVTSQLWLLAVVAVVNAVLGVAVYLRWLRAALAPPDPVADGGAPVAAAVRVHPATLVAVGFAAVALVVTSLSPQLVLGLFGS
jgi:NADH-quinone oxidoreductase subunit N